MIWLHTRARAPGEVLLLAALRPWEHRLTLLSVQQWLLRAAIAALILAIAVLLSGWFAAVPEAELRPWSLVVGAGALVAALPIGLWPRRRLARAADLDARLRLGDRLATAWTFRVSAEPIVLLQRANAVERLQQRTPAKDLRWRPARAHTLTAGALGLAFVVLLIAPSPQQAVLDKQAAEAQAVTQASQQLDVLREASIETSNLTPDQARQLNDLLQQAQAQLSQVHTQQDATAVLSRAEDQLSQQLTDPNAALRDEALAAMSETLAAEPQTQDLAAALQREDAQALHDALQALAAQADSESDVERQALSRALQRASNVGRGDPPSSAALRDAAQALANSGQSADALSKADAALQQAMQDSQEQSSVQATLDRLRELQAQLASGQPLRADQTGQAGQAANSEGVAAGNGTPVALDSSGSQIASEPAQAPGGIGAGTGQAQGAGQQTGQPAVAPAETVFVPGRESNGPANQDLVDQPFTLRGAPRPYRDVLSQYAASSRDYVDRPDVSPAVRELVKQYFQSLEDGQ